MVEIEGISSYARFEPGTRLVISEHSQPATGARLLLPKQRFHFHNPMSGWHVLGVVLEREGTEARVRVDDGRTWLLTPKQSHEIGQAHQPASGASEEWIVREEL